MPRKRRFYQPGIPAHVVQRGNCRQAVFLVRKDYHAYLDWLAEGAAKHGCAIHAYVLMTNHVHLLITPFHPHAISKTLQYVGRHYVPYVNKVYGKSGTLWEGRHKGCIIDSEHYLFACMRYIELNPVRAGMVTAPSDYLWSSYLANAAGRTDRLIVPHEHYLQLGRTPADRQMRYRELFHAALEPNQLHDIRATVQTGTPLGKDRFRKQIEQALGCKVGQSRRGRPG
jgi:putative transposase